MLHSLQEIKVLCSIRQGPTIYTLKFTLQSALNSIRAQFVQNPSSIVENQKQAGFFIKTHHSFLCLQVFKLPTALWVLLATLGYFISSDFSLPPHPQQQSPAPHLSVPYQAPAFTRQPVLMHHYPPFNRVAKQKLKISMVLRLAFLKETLGFGKNEVSEFPEKYSIQDGLGHTLVRPSVKHTIFWSGQPPVQEAGRVLQSPGNSQSMRLQIAELTSSIISFLASQPTAVQEKWLQFSTLLFSRSATH